VGTEDDVKQQVDKKQPFYNAAARTYIQPYPKEDIAKAKKVYDPRIIAGMQQGYVALYQKCVHLGCRVPWCESSQWFECPCHGSKYSINGEYRSGPAPRSLDRFRVDIVGGKVVDDTSEVITGPPRGTVTGQPAPEGVHCVNISGA